MCDRKVLKLRSLNPHYLSTVDNMVKDIITLDRNGVQVEIEGIKVDLPIKAVKSLPLAGEVYLIKCCQFYKIGASAQLKKRLSSIQTAIPFDIEFIDSFVSCDVFEDEKRLHRLCSEFNVKNEWFALPKSFAKNRGNWFKPSASPVPQIVKGIRGYMKSVDEKNIFPVLTGHFAYSPMPNEELMRNCFLLDTEISSQIIAAHFDLDIAEVHNNRYRGLYRKNATQLREEAGLKKSETPLDRLSAYDLNLNSLANQMALISGDSGKVLDAAIGLRQLHEQTVGKPLQPTWEEKHLRPNQAKAIAYSPEYQTELPVN